MDSSHDDFTLHRGEQYGLTRLGWRDSEAREIATARYDPERCHLSYLFVQQDKRDQGVGTRFLRHVEEAMRADGCTSCELTAVPILDVYGYNFTDNLETHYYAGHLRRFYRRAGYSNCSPFWKRWWTGNYYCMRKELQAPPPAFPSPSSSPSSSQ